MGKNLAIQIHRLSNLLDLSLMCWEKQHNAPDIRGENTLEILILKLHSLNFEIWHLEEQLRGKDIELSEIERVLRRTERLNSQRNKMIESIDMEICGRLQKTKGSAKRKYPNSESLGQIIDRLSIITLQIFHNELVLKKLKSRHQATAVENRLLYFQALREHLFNCFDKYERSVLEKDYNMIQFRAYKIWSSHRS